MLMVCILQIFHTNIKILISKVLAFLSVFGNKNQAESMNFAFRAYWKNYKTVWALLFFQSQYDKKPYYEVTDGGDEEDYDEIDVLMWNLVSESLL